MQTTKGPSVYNVNDLSNKQELGSLPGVKWTLSSHKPGAGVAALRDPDLSKLWQSDGTQPHVVDIQFPRRTAVTHVSIYLDTTLDDSYTPTNIGIKAGTYFGDLAEIRRRELESPKGWVHFVLNPEKVDSHEEYRTDLQLAAPIWIYHLQICIYSNHLNGKDTHLRSIRIFGPPTDEHKAAVAKSKVQSKLIEKSKAAGSKSAGGPHDRVFADLRTMHAYETLQRAVGVPGAAAGRAEDEGDEDLMPSDNVQPFDVGGRGEWVSRPQVLNHSLR